MKRIAIGLFLLGVTATFMLPRISSAEHFRITIMQDEKYAALRFKPVLDYLAKKGIDATVVEAKDYPAAAAMFVNGVVDAMFSGSGVAGVFMIKGLAVPLVRPLDAKGRSTYWAVVIAPKGAPRFTGSAEYFKGKKVIFTGLASSGEFFYRSLPGIAQVKATVLKAATQGEAITAVEKGQADIAIVKNRMWDELKGRYPNLTMVGEDKGENPDNTLIVSTTMELSLRAKVAAELLAVQNDTSPEAQAVKSTMKIKGFIKTTDTDFEHTMSLLKNAGVTKSFNFTD